MQLEKVFGVSKEPVASYIERDAVDSRLKELISEGSEQILIYGSSKQGKTALLHRHLPLEHRVTVHCSPANDSSDIYRSFLRQAGVQIATEKTSETGREMGASIAAKFTAMLPLFGKAEGETKGEIKATNGETVHYQQIEFNLASAQDVAELLLRVDDHKRFHVLENFHYLPEPVQQQLAFDLRTFEEMGIRFIILGVWQERNRLQQYNGDLLDRIGEVPVEPWEDGDFERVVQQGETALNIIFAPQVRQALFKESIGSVAILQELLKALCIKAGVRQTAEGAAKIISDMTSFSHAVSEKATEYAGRHLRSLESIAAGTRTRHATENRAALYLNYHFVRVVLRSNPLHLRQGLERKELYGLIVADHPNPTSVRPEDVTGMLNRLAKLQSTANIMPPLFDFDPATRRVKVVDSTLFFFLANSNADEVIDGIPHPNRGDAED